MDDLLLHSRSVRGVLEAEKPNKVLNENPPPIANEERKLGRETRTKLAQLRAGYSKMLCSYQSRIDQSVRDECPDCGESPHDTRHLFNCKTKPTTLDVTALWTEPVAAAAFLGI